MKIPQDLIDLIILQIQDAMSLITMNPWRRISVAWFGQHGLATCVYLFIYLFRSRIRAAPRQLTVPPWEFLRSMLVRTRHFLGYSPKSSMSRRFAFACTPITCGCCCRQAVRHMGHKVFYCSVHWLERKILKIHVR